MRQAAMRGEDRRPVEAGADDLVLEGIERSYGDVQAVRGVNLTVKAGELLTILGPSGCGKTTLLKLVAGFERPDRGRIRLGGNDVTNTPPSRRNIGMVFQNYALFPHMTAARNIAFPLEMRKFTRAEIDARVAQALETVAVKGMGERLPRQLSGGQQQRVALARAIVFDPELLLMDEPFGALDRKLREHMHVELKRLHERLRLTALFVTHDQEEALVLSDRIAIMQAGEIVQVGTPDEIYGQPASRFVASFIGESNLLDGHYLGNGDVQLASGLRLRAGTRQASGSGMVLVLIRPEAARLLAPDEPSDNRFGATVIERIYLGQSAKYRLALDDGLELLLRRSADRSNLNPKPGERVTVGFDRADVQYIG